MKCTQRKTAATAVKGCKVTLFHYQLCKHFDLYVTVVKNNSEKKMIET